MQCTLYEVTGFVAFDLSLKKERPLYNHRTGHQEPIMMHAATSEGNGGSRRPFSVIVVFLSSRK